MTEKSGPPKLNFFRKLCGDIAATVEQHGSAQLQTTMSFGAQLQHRYDGFRRDSAVESFTLLDQRDELFGWGFYLHHISSLTPIDPEPELDASLFLPEYRQAKREARQKQKAWFRVRISPTPQPTIAMMLIRATVSPLIIGNTSVQKLSSRLKRLERQRIPFDLVEKLRKLHLTECPQGVHVGVRTFTIEPIPSEDG